MLGFLNARLRERSTIKGGALLSIVLGMYLGPVQADIAAQALLALWGVFEVVRKEREA